MSIECYNREPLKTISGIPIFSEEDEYIKNYEKISAEHLTQIQKSGDNPFIPEHQWLEFEKSTVEEIKKVIKPGDKILDVGVGLGRTLSYFSDVKKYGVDISLGYLRESSQKNITTALAKIEELPYKDDFFDVIVCTDVLEHMLDLNLALKNILRVLKKGGYLIIRVPYRENLAQYLTPDYPYYYVHIRNFDENTLTLLFTRVFDCKIIGWNTVGDIINDERNKHKTKYYGRFWKVYQWYYRVLEKYFYSKYTDMFYKCEINFIVQKK